jgi:hypothetical protein
MIERKMDSPHGILVKVRAAKDVSNLSRGFTRGDPRKPGRFSKNGYLPTGGILKAEL